MKRTILTAIALFAIAGARSQSNTFPTSGNVGIGTVNPTAILTIEGSGLAGPLTTGNDDFSYIALGPWKSSGSGHDYRIGVDNSTMWFGAWNNYRWYRTQTGSIDMVLSNGSVGIGTQAPSARLTVEGGNVGIDGNHAPQQFYGAGGNIAGTNTTGGVCTVFGHSQNAYEDMSAPPYKNSTFVGAAGMIARGFSEGGQYRGSLELYTETGNAAASRMLITHDGNVGIGTTNPTQKLSVNGAIRAKEVIVDTGWSDYVFAPDYRLAPLSEVEQHIKAEKHLPGIPSAAEVAEHGISVGEMQAKLLAKIEELTLHQIEQEKEIKTLRAELKQIKP